MVCMEHSRVGEPGKTSSTTAIGSVLTIVFASITVIVTVSHYLYAVTIVLVLSTV